MEITVQKLPRSQVKLTITVPEEKTKKFMEQAAKQVSEMVKVPGFRPGHAPLDLLKNHVREGAIESHMIDIALPETYSEAVKKENLQVVSRPKVTIISESPLKYEAVVAVYPEVKISGYDRIKVKKEDAKVEDKDVEEVLKDIQKRHAVYKEVDREAKKGDRVEIDFMGYDEGGAYLEKTESKHHPVVIGDGNFVPGFEESLIGLKKGEKKEFTVTFPKEYFHKPFQGKKVTFKVGECHMVEEVQMPEWSAEFIKEIAGEEKSLDELKTNVRENLARERGHQEKVRREDNFLDEVANLAKVDLPEALIEEEIDSMLEEFKSELEGRGLTLQAYLEGAKKEIKDLRDQRRKEAEKRLMLRFGLQQIFQQEKIDATDEDMKKEITHVLELYPEAERAKVQAEYDSGSYLRRRLENKIKMQKLFDAYLK